MCVGVSALFHLLLLLHLLSPDSDHTSSSALRCKLLTVHCNHRSFQFQYSITSRKYF
jgi:hypothetical protein